MSEDAESDPVPYAPSSQDVSVLIGIMAVLEGECLSGSLDDHLMLRIGDRFKRHGLLADSVGIDDVRGALTAMNHRLRHAIGENDEPPG